jgi:hypothetical protein
MRRGTGVRPSHIGSVPLSSLGLLSREETRKLLVGSPDAPRPHSRDGVAVYIPAARSPAEQKREVFGSIQTN